MATHSEAVLIKDGDYLTKLFQSQGVPRQEALARLKQQHPQTYAAYAKTLPPKWSDDGARRQLVRLTREHVSRHGGSRLAGMKAVLAERPDLADALTPDGGAGRARNAKQFSQAHGWTGRK